MMLLFLVDSKKMMALGAPSSEGRQRRNLARISVAGSWQDIPSEAATSVAGSACSFSVSNTGSTKPPLRLGLSGVVLARYSGLEDRSLSHLVTQGAGDGINPVVIGHHHYPRLISRPLWWV